MGTNYFPKYPSCNDEIRLYCPYSSLCSFQRNDQTKWTLSESGSVIQTRPQTYSALLLEILMEVAAAAVTLDKDIGLN